MSTETKDAEDILSSDIIKTRLEEIEKVLREVVGHLESIEAMLVDVAKQ